MTMRLLSTPMLLAAALVTAAPRTTPAQTERKTVSGNAVAIYNLAGKVTIEAGSGSDVVVEITRGGRDAAKLGVEVGDVRGRNALRIMYPSDDIVYPPLDRWSNSTFSMDRDGTWGGDHKWYSGRRVRIHGGGSGLEAWADLRILVPNGKKVDVNVGVGTMDATNVHGDLKLDVGAARVTTRGTVGNLTIDAGSGGASVRDASGGNVSVETGSGGIEVDQVAGGSCKFDTGSGGLTGGRVACDDLTIDAGSGSVRLADVKSARVKADAGSGGITLGLLLAPRDLSVDAGSGGVTVGLPSNTGADVDIETGSGGIESDFPLTVDRVERHHVRGRIGDGTGRIRIESGSGSVRLRKS